MTEECPSLPNCGFFKKYQESKDLVCRGFIRRYCKGPEQGDCKRREYRMKHGTPPPDEMMPSGHMIAGSGKTGS